MGLDRIAVVGAGAWGVALANVGARAGRAITLVARDQKAAAAFSQTRESPRLPGVAIEERVRIGDFHRAQLRVGTDGAVVVADVGADRVAPAGGGASHLVKVRVSDVDAAFARARDNGARVVEELTTWEYGERSGVVEDLGGHRWELTQTLRDLHGRWTA